MEEFSHVREDRVKLAFEDPEEYMNQRVTLTSKLQDHINQIEFRITGTDGAEGRGYIGYISEQQKAVIKEFTTIRLCVDETVNRAFPLTLYYLGLKHSIEVVVAKIRELDIEAINEELDEIARC